MNPNTIGSRFQPRSNGEPVHRSGLPTTILQVVGTMVIALGLVATFALLSVNRGHSAVEPAVKEFTLVAEEVEWELMPGTTVTAWAYNGQMPGPEIRVREGDLVRIIVKNNLPTGTTVHWHGINVPNDMDGPVGLNQAAIETGESFVYEFEATPAGTRWYHSHTDVSTQVMLGLYGAFIIDPKNSTQQYDRDYTYVLSEWDMELTPNVALGLDPRGPRDSTLRGGEFGTDFFLFNGKMHEAISPVYVEEGDRVLIRLINAGTVSHPIHTHGHSFKVVATDGNPVPPAAQLTKDTILVAPGERYDIEFVADNAGVWMMHCHIENHADNGMMTVIQYAGEIPPGPLGEYWNPEAGGQRVPGKSPVMMNSGHMGHSPTVGSPTATASEGAVTQVPADQSSGEVLSGEVTVILVDNRFVPKILVIEAGTTVTFYNNGSNWHSLAGDSGRIESGQIASGQSYSVTFNDPGTFRLICAHHLRQGMTAEVTVVG
ncbi:hypothetical protein BH23CHL5_BH23CHL5_02460 [soil metagenome]